MTKTMLEARSSRSSQVSASDKNIVLAAKGGGIAFAGNLSTYITRFAFGVVLARSLGPDMVGLYSLSLTVTQIAATLASLGLSAAMARYVSIAASQEDEDGIWGTIQIGIAIPSLVSAILAAGIILLARPISYRVFGRSDLAPLLRLASLSIPLLSMVSMLSAITQGFKRMEYKVYAEDITLNLLKLILLVVLVGLGYKVMGAMIGHIVALAVAMAMLLYFVHRLFPLNRSPYTSKRKIGEILSFSLPLYLSGLLSRFSGGLETLMLGFFGVMSGVGIYTTALRLSDIGKMFHHSLQRIAVPMIADLYHQNKMDQLGQVYQTITRWGMTFNLPVFLTLAIFAKPLLVIFGADFVAGTAGLIILAFGTLFNASTGVCGSVVTMTGHSRLTFANSIIYLVTNIALDLLLIPAWGGIGAALAVTVTDVIINILRTVQVFVLFRIWPYNRSFLKPVIASVVAGGTTYLIVQRLTSLPVILEFVLGVLWLWGTYASIIMLLKLSDEDHLVLDRLWARFGVGWARDSILGQG